ncbi:MAG: DEAD/DEAH box helicase, partial [Bacteroidales bacterium]|nr:DEAD/DEAH box helicase [Bacteroidales bacterium]
MKNQLTTNFHKLEDEFANASDETINYNPEDYYIDGEQFVQGLFQRKWVEINANTEAGSILSLDFDIKPQNSFGKNFNLLLDEWIDNLEHGYRTIFLSENENQQERVRVVVDDLLQKYNLSKKTEYTLEQLYTPCNFVLHEGFTDENSGLCVYTDHQFFEKYHRFSIRDRYKKSEQFTLKEIYDLQPGDYVVHIDHGIGIYQGLQKMDVNGKEQEVIKLSYKDGDLLYISIHSLHKITKYVGKDGMPPKLHRLGSGTWDRVKERTKKRVKEIAIDLIQLYAQRKAKDGFAFSADSFMQNELEASFMYEDTPDQVKSLNEVKNDMESIHPMDRLICGDVGFGKTEIAVRAAFKAVADSKQVAVLVPTTVLALQHYTTFSERLAQMPCKVEYVNRFKTAKQIRQVLQNLKEGKVDIIIGTHRLLSKDLEFKDLGLLIIDEEQKFGVAAKEKLRELKYNVDTLTMSATPIPRTLQFSLMGARDISVITTPPPNRYPIQTEVHLFDEALIRDAISYEVSRGGQVFFVHNKMQN